MPIGFNSDTQTGLYLPGSVVQTQSVNNTYSVSTASTSPQPSGHKITFTAKYSNSKLYFTLTAGGLYNNDGWIFLRIRNNTSASYIHTTEFGRYNTTIASGTITVNLLVNAPNTSANEYEIYFYTNNPAGTATYGAGYLCALTVMEIQQ